MRNLNPYTVLGIPETASAQDIVRAYRRLIKRWHPDRNPGNPLAEQKSQEINAAYKLLTNSYMRLTKAERAEAEAAPGQKERYRQWRAARVAEAEAQAEAEAETIRRRQEKVRAEGLLRIERWKLRFEQAKKRRTRKRVLGVGVLAIVAVCLLIAIISPTVEVKELTVGAGEDVVQRIRDVVQSMKENE